MFERHKQEREVSENFKKSAGICSICTQGILVAFNFTKEFPKHRSSCRLLTFMVEAFQCIKREEMLKQDINCNTTKLQQYEIHMHIRESIRQTLNPLALVHQSCKQLSKAQNRNVLEIPPRWDHVLCRTSERGCHRVDLKDVACVNMRDSS